MLRRAVEALLAESPEAVVVQDDTGRFLDANPAACALLGYARDELLQLWRDAVVPTAAQRSIRRRGNGSAWSRWQGPLELCHKDGTFITADASSVIISGPDGEVTVTALRASPRGSTPGGVGSGRARRPSPARARAESGGPAHGANGHAANGPEQCQQACEPGPEEAAGASSSSRGHANSGGRDVDIAAKPARLAQLAGVESLLALPDVRMRIDAGQDDAGAEGLVRAANAVATAVADAETAQAAGRLASDARFRQLLDQAPVLYITTCDHHGQPVVMDANPLFLSTLGYAREEIIGRPLLDFYAPRSRAGNHKAEGRRGRGKGIAAQARQLLTRDGQVVDVLLWSWPEQELDGCQAGARIACVNVTEWRRTEEALRQSEERFRTAFEHAAIGMTLVDPEGHILQANAAFCALTGYTEAELLTRTVHDITHPDDLTVAHRQVRRLLAGEMHAYQVEKRYIRKDGDTVWVRLSASLERDTHGTPLHLIGQVEDITARKRAEEELRASEERYRRLVDHLPAAVYLLAADENETPLYFSPYIENLTGETPEEAQSLRDHWLTLVHPDDRDRVAAEDARAATAEIFLAEYRHRRKNGDYVWVRDACVPLIDPAGEILGWQGFMIDISDQVRLKALERESRTRQEQRDQLQVILDHLPVGILILREPDGQVEQANATATQMIFGRETTARALPMHRRDFRLVWEDRTLRARQQQVENRTLGGEPIQNEQLLLETVDGRLIPVLAHAAPLPATAEGIARSVLVVQDVTRLREAEQLKDDFMALVSHEFRTPLTAIHGGAHLLHTQCGALDDATRAELLRDIVIESDRLERRLRNILNLTAIMAGQLAVETEPVMLGALVREVTSELAVQLPRHTLHLDVPAQLPPAEADPALLAEVLSNLYENAAKYSAEGSEITTSAYSTEQTIVLEVSDTGIGFSPEQAEHVFERFHRAGVDPTVRGMGLGLYLSRFLTEAQGGALTARSPGPGQGATFIITLPIAREWAQRPAGP